MYASAPGSSVGTWELSVHTGVLGQNQPVVLHVCISTAENVLLQLSLGKIFLLSLHQKLQRQGLSGTLIDK